MCMDGRCETITTRKQVLQDSVDHIENKTFGLTHQNILFYIEAKPKATYLMNLNGLNVFNRLSLGPNDLHPRTKNLTNSNQLLNKDYIHQKGQSVLFLWSGRPETFRVIIRETCCIKWADSYPIKSDINYKPFWKIF